MLYYVHGLQEVQTTQYMDLYEWVKNILKSTKTNQDVCKQHSDGSNWP